MTEHTPLYLYAEIDRLCAELTALKEQLAAAQKDAERYRWLRAAPWTEIERICWDCPQNVSMEEARAIFDVNVDAAIKEG